MPSTCSTLLEPDMVSPLQADFNVVKFFEFLAAYLANQRRSKATCQTRAPAATWLNLLLTQVISQKRVDKLTTSPSLRANARFSTRHDCQTGPAERVVVRQEFLPIPACHLISPDEPPRPDHQPLQAAHAIRG